MSIIKKLSAIVLAASIVFGISACGESSEQHGGEIQEHYDEATRTLSYTGDFPEGTLFVRIPEEKDIVTADNKDQGTVEYIDQELIVLSAAGVSYSRMEALFESYDLMICGYIAMCDTYQVRCTKPVKNGALTELMEKLRKEDEVAKVGLNLLSEFESESSSSPDDPWDDDPVSATSVDGSNWGVEAIGAPWYWQNYNMEGIRVGVIDNMFIEDHEDLRFKDVYQNDYKFFELDKAHGTQVSSVIAATYDNGKGMTGVLKNPALYATDRFPGEFKNCSDLMEHVLKIALLLQNGCKVINLSFAYAKSNFEKEDQRKEKALNDAEELTPHMKRILENGRDFVLVVAAGNDGETEFRDAEYSLWLNATDDPDIRGRVIVVGNAKHNKDNSYSINTESNRGDRVDVMAPGTHIYTCVPPSFLRFFKKYYFSEGTSLAAPFVTAACAALWEYYPALSGADIKTLLVKTADIPVNGISAKMINMRSAFGGYPENAIENHSSIDLQTLLTYKGYGGSGTENSAQSGAALPTPAPTAPPPATVTPTPPPATPAPTPTPTPTPTPVPDYNKIYKDFVDSGEWASMLSHYADVYDPGYIRRYNDTWQDTYSPGSSGYSYIYDIDGNGVPELIMNGGI